MEKRTVMMMVFMLIVILAWQKECHGWGAETADEMVRNESEHAKNAAETATNMAAKATRDAKDKTASWTGWVSDKIST